MSDACHTRQSNVQRSRDGLLTVCGQCARGVDLPTSRCGRGDCSVGQPRSRPRTAGPWPVDFSRGKRCTKRDASADPPSSISGD